MSKDLFIPADFDAIYPLCKLSDNPRHNVLVFDYIRDWCRVSKLLMETFPSCIDDVYNVERPGVCIDSAFSEKLCMLSLCMYSLTAIASVDIAGDFHKCLEHWSSAYHDVLRIACSCPVVALHLSKFDRDYLDDACFPWYMRAKDSIGISPIPFYDGDVLPY